MSDALDTARADLIAAFQQAYDLGFADGYAQAHSKIYEYFEQNTSGGVGARSPLASKASLRRSLDEERPDNRKGGWSRPHAPYGSVKPAILQVLRTSKEPMRPANIRAALVARGNTLVKEETVRSTLHKMALMGGEVKNTSNGWVFIEANGRG
ncbi:MAG: hypothetical protein ACLPIC_16935 [Rhodoblastus sp.]|uniref:hypothetical protein n=1 Tax=Rhodoblastus sp. TaxID=1962975 RepID=UPI003F961619